MQYKLIYDFNIYLLKIHEKKKKKFNNKKLLYIIEYKKIKIYN